MIFFRAARETPAPAGRRFSKVTNKGMLIQRREASGEKFRVFLLGGKKEQSKIFLHRAGRGVENFSTCFTAPISLTKKYVPGLDNASGPLCRKQKLIK